MRTKAELDEAIRLRRRAVLVVNARSRRGRRLYSAARSRLIAAGFTLLGAYPVDRPGELETSLARASDLAPDLLIAGGGDGTIGAAARLLAHRDIALGLLPLGTTNNFARTVGIPLGLDAAVATLTGGKVVDVDLGLAGGMPFANHVGIGLSAEVMLRAPARLKRAAGRLAYPVTALGLLPTHQPVRFTVESDGQTRMFHTHQLYVANGGFQAGRPITADANADDRLLVAYPVGGPGRGDLLRATARNAATGHRRTLADVPFLATGELLLRTDRPAPVEVDGEVHGQTPIRIGLDANALRVMAPIDTVDR
ncbi:YegS/Rv2252/BmrU family lipid kinase [Solwaraspora sp. WMMD1047]|uniref:diacylglycerol/lipid kinase family protein n=1 Tax=Solwaraspora sp. WMMD1047 TaxID=3016102 RepID=UPI00241812D8|nr:YegS/Rv2252/BmrU family lipid kinase [Solwaraspora sp. WMMD1047]MDG4830803.1 YegS/Rv2252/BmrU family lipid kinase [Solwaraspora sp. WMMD1047]